ncbi:MAG TPA: hypothetical protein VGI10_03495 [Polyangiaceae bacterium]
MSLRWLTAAISALLLGASCAGTGARVSHGPQREAKPSSASVSAPSTAAVTSATSLEPAQSAVQPVNSPIVAVTEPSELAELEANGFALARLLVNGDATTTAELAKLSAFQSLFDVVRADVRDAARPHPLARVTSIDGFRLFDERWLASSEMSFALAGVFNRLDRRAFYARSCGEVRFLYRLGYRTTQGGAPMSSRLPMMVNVVFLLDDAGDATCQRSARGWLTPPDVTGPALTRWLAQTGALAPVARAHWSLKSVETNLQTFRLQSSVLPSLAGHIEYDLRVFHATGDARHTFAPAPMENMPDAPRLAKARRERDALLAYLREPTVLASLDRGTLTVPDSFLAKRATSFAPRGLSRRANRPFSLLFGERDFSGLDLSRFSTIRSPAALLRRLDAASCSGCHESRSIAGFHFVGMDRADEPGFNALFSGLSSHLERDLERRARYVAALAAGHAPDEFRPLPERQAGGTGFGAPCGLGDPGFADWTCAAGLSCTRLEDREVGVCLSAESEIGSPCEYGELHDAQVPYRDSVANMSKPACRAACDGNFSGFPLGACVASCKSHNPALACSAFLDVDGFQNCLRAHGSFNACAAQFVSGLGVRACDARTACRQDYVCARTAQPGVGACIPPYFLYQLRLDGYPIAR